MPSRGSRAPTRAPRRRPVTSRSPARRGKRRVTADDLLRLALPGSPRISPDGKTIVFVHKTTSDTFASETSLWSVPARGGDATPLTAGTRDRAPDWSPDGRTLAFIRADEAARPQIALLPVDGGEARTLTDFPEGSIAAVRWSPDGVHLAVTFREQDPDWTSEAVERRKDEGRQDAPRVLDDPWYRLDGDGYFNAQRFTLWIVDAQTGARHEMYTKDRTGLFTWSWMPDGERIALATNRHKHGYVKEWTSELAVLDIHTGEVSGVAGPPAGAKYGVAACPDGKHLAWAGVEDEDGSHGTDNFQLYVTNLRSGKTRNLTEGSDLCLVAPVLGDCSEVAFEPTLRWSPDGKRIWCAIGWQGTTQLVSVSRGGGDLVVHTKGKRQHQLGNLSADGRRAVVCVDDVTHPPEVAVVELPTSAGAARGAKPFKLKAGARACAAAGAPAKVTTLTALNAAWLAEVELADARDRWVRSADGTPVQCWTMLPPGASPSRKRPTILEVHGGPQAQYGFSFFHEFQLLCAQGWAVVFSNPRGSKGYGEAHTRGIHHAWGTKDWEDVQAVADFAESQSFCDAKRFGIMGGSYGGFMTLWAIGHTRRFRAAIADRCVSNMVSMWGTSDIYLWPNTYFPGNAWDDTAANWEMSPLKHIGNAKTPTLLIHSEGDLRCNIAESEQVHAALSMRGVPTRFVRYPRTTSHGMSRSGPADMRIHRLEQITSWWRRWMDGRR